MVKPRTRTVAPTEAEIEAFGNQAEQRTKTPAISARKTKAPYVTGVNFRMTENQKELLQLASEKEDISQQKVLEKLVWPILAEKYN